MLPQNCWIEELEVGKYALDTEGVLPGGIRIGMAEKEFQAVLDENGIQYEWEASGDFNYYTYNELEYGQCFDVTVYTADDGSFPKDTIMEIACRNAFQ